MCVIFVLSENEAGLSSAVAFPWHSRLFAGVSVFVLG